MFPIQGKYNTAIVFTHNICEKSVKQLLDICNMEIFQDSKIRVMPDVHLGSGCTIGTTMTIKDKVVPNWVGVDIGCGVDVVAIEECKIDFEKLDKHIRKFIPFGQQVNQQIVKEAEQLDLNELYCVKSVNLERAYKSVMSLGGGNHYIEVNQDSGGTIYICVHSGSRQIGAQCAKHYQDLAIQRMSESKKEREKIVEALRAEGRTNEIEAALKNIVNTKIAKEMSYLSGTETGDYLHDMAIMQHYASVNRRAILKHIITGLRLTEKGNFASVHNYIDMDRKILRKGAISAQVGEKLIIPINMRDGAIIGIGKGNSHWNYSAPHGAGRIHSRRSAQANISLEDFQASMKGIWTSCVNQETVDESPMAYKPIEEIMSCIGDSVEIIDIIKPLYNFKATE